MHVCNRYILKEIVVLCQLLKGKLLRVLWRPNQLVVSFLFPLVSSINCMKF